MEQDQPQPPRAQLLIVLNHDGTIGVSGPIDNKLLSLGMIECAKEAIIEHIRKATSLISAPPPGFRGDVLKKM